jgi:hypothetical protein
MVLIDGDGMIVSRLNL